MDSPVVRFTNELMRLIDDVTQAAAADFVSRAYDAGLEGGRAERAPDELEGDKRALPVRYSSLVTGRRAP